MGFGKYQCILADTFYSVTRQKKILEPSLQGPIFLLYWEPNYWNGTRWFQTQHFKLNFDAGLKCGERIPLRALLGTVFFIPDLETETATWPVVSAELRSVPGAKLAEGTGNIKKNSCLQLLTTYFFCQVIRYTGQNGERPFWRPIASCFDYNFSQQWYILYIQRPKFLLSLIIFYYYFFYGLEHCLKKYIDCKYWSEP